MIAIAFLFVRMLGAASSRDVGWRQKCPYCTICGAFKACVRDRYPGLAHLVALAPVASENSLRTTESSIRKQQPAWML